MTQGQRINALTAARRRMLAVLAIAAWTAVAVLWAAPGRAETVFGCTDLDGRHAQASVEGDGGFFFRITPDLITAPAFSDGTVMGLAQLSDALAARGTRLVFVPLPSRALAMPQILPPITRDLGFDPAIAATLYDDALVRLTERGILTANARTTLRGTPDAPTIFAADPRLTTAGTRALARAIGAVIGADTSLSALPRGTFQSREAGPVTLASPLRAALQRLCRLTLPPVTVDGFATTRVDAGGTDSALLGTGPAPQVALLGTLEAVDPALNLAGFLSEVTGLPVQAYGAAWGDEPGAAFAAISSYLTSPAFDANRPAVIVWVVPMSSPLADQGDAPLRELAAAARGDCVTVLAPGAGAVTDGLTFALPPTDPARPGLVLADLGAIPARVVEFAFTGPDGTTRSRFVTRHPDQIATGRFIAPIDGLWAEGATAVTIRADVALDAGGARALLCPDPVESP